MSFNWKRKRNKQKKNLKQWAKEGKIDLIHTVNDWFVRMICIQLLYMCSVFSISFQLLSFEDSQAVFEKKPNVFAVFMLSLWRISYVFVLAFALFPHKWTRRHEKPMHFSRKKQQRKIFYSFCYCFAFDAQRNEKTRTECNASGWFYTDCGFWCHSYCFSFYYTLNKFCDSLTFLDRYHFFVIFIVPFEQATKHTKTIVN